MRPRADPRSAGPTWLDRIGVLGGRITPSMAIAAAVAAFLVSRLLFIDRDVPRWWITQYYAGDEFGYSVPAFNLLHYGTWTHQAASWAPIEGWPMNVLQNLLTFVTLRLAGTTYLGLRLSSVLFGLVTFVGVLAIVRTQAREATADGDAERRTAVLVCIGAAAILLLDFSFLVASRVVEPTISRLAVVTAVIWLVSSGRLLRPGRGAWDTAVFGALVSAAVWFAYVYNLFMLPGALLATVLVHRGSGFATVVRHATAFVLGAALSAGAYFAFVWIAYGLSPGEWSSVYIAAQQTSTRLSASLLPHLSSILSANLFRLDRPLLLLSIVGIPVLLWWTWRRARPYAILSVCLALSFVAQSAFVADYPARKFVAFLPFTLMVAAALVLHARALWASIAGLPWARIALLAWVAGASIFCLTKVHANLGGGLAPTIRVADVASVVGLSLAALGLVVARGRRLSLAVGTVGAVALGLAIVIPSAIVDRQLVVREPGYSYRTALIAARSSVGGQDTAGGLSFWMQLYNDSRPVLNAYFYRITRDEYVADVVRYFTEGHATSMFDYADAQTEERWTKLGFRLVEEYDIVLPHGMKIGRYVFVGGGP